MVDDGPTNEPAPQPQPESGQPQAGGGGVGSSADVGTRFIARLIDHVLLGIVLFAILIPVVIGAMFADVGGFGGMFGGFGAGSLVSSIVGAVITIGYFAVMESNRGQTVGKMVMGLRTEGPNGGNPTMEEAIKRNAWYAVAIVPWIGGLAQMAIAIYIAVTISNSGGNTGWHDDFAGGTKVVRAK